MVAKVANEAVEIAAIENPEYVYAAVRNNTETRTPEITISISSEYDDAYITYSFDGEILNQFGSVFDE
jgi:hypothetical protein